MRTLFRGRKTPGQASSGLGMLVVGASSQQFGAAVGASLFPVLGPVGVVAVRQVVMAAVHLPLGRPPVLSMTRGQLMLGIGLGVVMGMMNLTLYLAIDRIGLGLAVTLEFLGPLTLALLSSKRLINVVCALAAASGVYILAGPQTSNDLVGILLGLSAGACWAGYILTNRAAGARLPGLQASAMAAVTSVVMFVPVAAFTVDLSGVTTQVILIGILAGVLSSAVPYAADLFVLRRIPPGLYSLMVSIHPALAALAGLVLLAETLTLLEVVAIAVITLANVLAVAAVYRDNKRYVQPVPPRRDQDVV
ncbi:EamA family transporter [Arthrobacter castelli]|uniref:EamA family transporter n=1 Tax=Arthrobacter castelli TaxID=271431 RepID=UPI000419815D|nr:EamA family transporter [Arthrobacter castelli]